ncbi:hypothetical protein HK102_005135, partial [Quaeritorhiza haematococci]
MSSESVSISPASTPLPTMDDSSRPSLTTASILTITLTSLALLISLFNLYALIRYRVRLTPRTSLASAPTLNTNAVFPTRRKLSTASVASSLPPSPITPTSPSLPLLNSLRNHPGSLTRSSSISVAPAGGGGGGCEALSME